MKVKASSIRIFKMKNRKGYAALCKMHLTEGKTLHQVYDRMLKALKRSKIEVVGKINNIKRLVKKSI